MKVVLARSELAGPISGADETLVRYAIRLHGLGYLHSVVLLYRPAEDDPYLRRLLDAGISVAAVVSKARLRGALVTVRRLAIALRLINDVTVAPPATPAVAPVVNESTQPARIIPKIDGPPARAVALDLLSQLQQGKVKRDALGEEYSVFLTDQRLAAAKERLGPLGEPDQVEIIDTRERGGMEVVVIRFTYKGTTLKASLYRTPDGKIQQFLVKKS